MKKVIKAFLPTAEAVAKLLYPYAEVVIHDIEANKIAAIYNAFSKRKVGGDSLLTKEEISNLEDCIGPYEKTNWDGKKLKSITSVIRNEKAKAVGLFCINLNISDLEKINNFIIQFINAEQFIAPPGPLFKDDWQERINNYIHNYLIKHHLALESLTRSEKKHLIEHLHAVGAFTGKHAAHYIAQIIKLSRASVYNYLKEPDQAG